MTYKGILEDEVLGHYLKAQQIVQNKSTKTNLIQFHQMEWRDLSILSNTITFYFY